MRILFTGASSFTGYHFAAGLAGLGHEVTCTLQKRLNDYGELRAERLRRLSGKVQFAEQTSFGSESFLQLLRAKPFDVLCHHGADVTNYKSADFDPLTAVENNTRGLVEVLRSFKTSGGKGLVLTGTIFEPDEGQGDVELRAFSPYGLSKGLTWQVFRYYCEREGVRLGKFVLPNPFGPLEDARFTTYLMNTWKAGKVAQVRTPDYLRDSCHVSLLSLVYAEFAAKLSSANAPGLKSAPSGYVETVGRFTERVANETKTRTG